MLRRQKVVLSLLLEAKRSLTRTAVEKLLFLARQETVLRDDPSFYDFVPSHGGPISFSFTREVELLRRKGFLTGEGERLGLALERFPGVREAVKQLPDATLAAVHEIVRGHGRMGRDALVHDVLRRYSWYATVPECNGTALAFPVTPEVPPQAVYSMGYESQSVEGYLNRLLREGIQVIADVRSHPVSRKFGFAQSALRRLAPQLGITYRDFPGLGIPSDDRVKLDGFASYQRLLDAYEQEILPKRRRELSELVSVVRCRPTVLLCFEADVRCCHRSRLAAAVARRTGLPVRHLELGLMHTNTGSACSNDHPNA